MLILTSFFMQQNNRWLNVSPPLSRAPAASYETAAWLGSPPPFSNKPNNIWAVIESWHSLYVTPFKLRLVCACRCASVCAQPTGFSGNLKGLPLTPTMTAPRHATKQPSLFWWRACLLLLVSVFLCWLGYGVCVRGGSAKTRFCSGKCSYKTACQPAHLFSPLKSVFFHLPSLWFIFKTMYSPFFLCTSLSAYRNIWFYIVVFHLSDQIT